MQLFDWLMTARKVAITAANTISKLKTVFEMTVAGLDDDDTTDAQQLQ